MTDIKVNVRALIKAEREKYQEKIKEEKLKCKDAEKTIKELNAQIRELDYQVRELQGMVLYERERREYAEGKLAESEQEKQKRKRRTKAEVEAERAKKKEYSEFKSNGVRKKTKMEPIASYTDFRKIQQYFLGKKQFQYYAIWTIGVCMGVRASDLVVLKWKNVLNEDNSFKERVKLYEQKTGKLQNCLITEGVQSALTVLLNDMEWNVNPEDFIFPSEGKPGYPVTRDACYKNLCKAAEASGIEYSIGTHTMRASFANIVLCIDKSTIDMNAITKIQGLLNHSDARVTMKYLGKLDEMYDKARKTVSDFVLGKTDVDKLVCGDAVSADQIMDKLTEIERQLRSGNETAGE